MSARNVIFDLDGTLVDSAPGILAALSSALEQHGISPAVSLEPGLIGPPLRETLMKVAGTTRVEVLDRLVDAFKTSYDSEGCIRTRPYPGVEGMLRALAAAGPRLFIATNKRARPTGMIIRHLAWDGLFDAVYSLDSFADAVRSKADLLEQLMTIHALERHSTLYVGDRTEDGLAAEANGLAFVMATWGYGGVVCDVGRTASWVRLAQPDADHVLAGGFGRVP